jgi:hypothetical protein
MKAAPLFADIAVRGACDDREPSVPGSKQAIDQLALSRHRIAADRRRVRTVGDAVVKDQRHLAVVEQPNLFVRQPRRADHPIDAVPPDLVEHFIDVAFGVEREQQHAQVACEHLVRQFGENLGIVQRGQARDEHRDEVGASRDQRLRQRIGAVSEFVRRLDDPRARRRRDAPRRREAARHRGLRDARKPRDIVRRRPAALPGRR